VDRTHTDSTTYLIRGFLKKGSSDPDRFINRIIVHSDSGISGKIVSTFGKSGLLRAEFQEPLPDKSIGTKVILDIDKPALAKIIDSH
jgi:ribosomal protein L35AE/L33A